MTHYTIIDTHGNALAHVYESATEAVLAGFWYESIGALEPGWDWGLE